jgi:predicted DNA-binding transcriptional regulator AlpA
MFDFKSLVVKYMRDVADKIEVGTSEISESQAIDILRIVAHEAMSKEQACSYLNLSRARFDDLVREKKLPKGKKRVGFKELVFYKDELDLAWRKLRDKSNKR